MTTWPTNPDRELLAELLLRWEELYEQGNDTPASVLAKERPDLAPELARRIQALKTVSAILTPPPRLPRSQSPLKSLVATGARLGGRYRLEKLLAEGGFAEVYRAFDEELQRPVAIKVPKPGRLESNDSFLAEARRVARLRHDGIVPVYDVGVEAGSCFIVSEFLEGGTLADQLTKEKPSAPQACRWIAEVADALEYAHLHGVIHRDVKPGNLLVDHHGRAKLADFGIAQSASKADDSGLSIGTLRYMSPEQLEGKAGDHRSDIFSLGVVLHEMLTGELPYRSLEPQTLRRDILTGSPRSCLASTNRSAERLSAATLRIARRPQRSLRPNCDESAREAWAATPGSFRSWRSCSSRGAGLRRGGGRGTKSPQTHP